MLSPAVKAKCVTVTTTDQLAQLTSLKLGLVHHSGPNPGAHLFVDSKTSCSKKHHLLRSKVFLHLPLKRHWFSLCVGSWNLPLLLTCPKFAACLISLNISWSLPPSNQGVSISFLLLRIWNFNLHGFCSSSLFLWYFYAVTPCISFKYNTIPLPARPTVSFL